MLNKMLMIRKQEKRISSSYIYLIFFLWTICLRFFAESQSSGIDFANVPVFLLAYGTFGLGSFLAGLKLKDFKRIALFPFLLSILPILGTEPLFENDHYRYLWEGQVFSAGFNPYLIAPANDLLTHVVSSFRHLVGYNLLTSPYSPGAILFYSFFSSIKYKLSLTILQLISAISVWGLMKNILPEIKKDYLPFVIPVMLLFIKEFIQSVHIDILCYIPFFFSIRFFVAKEFHKGLVFLIASLMFKITPLLIIPSLVASIISDGIRPLYQLTLLSLGILFCGLLFYAVGFFSFEATNGIGAFATHWVWNGGLLIPLLRLGIDSQVARIVCGIVLIVSVSGIVLYLFRRRPYAFSLIAMIFTSYLFLTFLSPVSNPWYSVWLAIPSLIIGNKFGIVYCLFLPLGYLHFSTPQLSVLFTVCTHIWFFPSLISFFKFSHAPELIFRPKEAL
ncbi:MAG: hypothetical protein K2P81_11645 [Bacteriovoracaceae bacterium]|nr:hypothetical protein [Bacteriovoracaceae bacterium]